jgi:hypothetical protein
MVKRVTKTVVQVAPARPKRKQQRKKRGQKQQQTTQTMVRAPAAMGYRTQSRAKPNVVRVTGSTLLAEVPVTTSLADSTLLNQFSIAPQAFLGSRIAALATAFGRYRFTNFRIVVTTKFPSAVSGGYIAAVFRDPTTQLASGLALKNQLMSADVSCNASWWMSSKLDNGLKANSDPSYSQGWYTDAASAGTTTEPHSYFQGLFALMIDGQLSGVTVNTTYSITVTAEFDIEFWQATSRAVQGTGLSPDYAPISLAYPLPGINLFVITALSVLAPNPALPANQQTQAASYITEIMTTLGLKNTGATLAPNPVVYMLGTPIPQAAGNVGAASGPIGIVAVGSPNATPTTYGINPYDNMTNAAVIGGLPIPGTPGTTEAFGGEQGDAMVFFPVYLQKAPPPVMELEPVTDLAGRTRLRFVDQAMKRLAIQPKPTGESDGWAHL